MAHEAPVNSDWPLDQGQQEHLEMVHHPQQTMCSDSSHSSGNLQISSTITIAIYQELLRAQENISLMNSGLIRVKEIGANDSPQLDLPTVKNLDNSIVPILRLDEAILARIALKLPYMHLEIGQPPNVIHDMGLAGMDCPGSDVSTKNFMANSTGGIIGGALSGSGDGDPMRFVGQSTHESIPGTKADLPIPKSPKLMNKFHLI